jgi:hypothetical protein
VARLRPSWRASLTVRKERVTKDMLSVRRAGVGRVKKVDRFDKPVPTPRSLIRLMRELRISPGALGRSLNLLEAWRC